MLGSLSYGTKLYGTAVVLISLTIGVTSISMLLADRIETRLTVLADAYAPLADDLSAVESLALRQEVMYERALLLSELHQGAERLAADRRAFEALADKLEARLDTSEAHLAKALDGHLPDAAVTALSGVGDALTHIEREHADWQAHARAVLDAPETWTVERAALIEREGDEFTDAIDRLRSTMSAYTRDTAVAARADEATLQTVDVILTAIAAVLGLILAALLTAGLVRPVRALLGGMMRVKQGALETHIEVASQDEVGQLTDGFNLMVSELVIKEQLTETFGRFVDPRIVRDLIDDPELADGIGQRRTMSVLFSDIAGFTTLSEKLDPRTLVRALNAWLTAMSGPIDAERGVIDKFIGDAILAWWGQPFVPESEAAVRACRAALGKRNLLATFNADLPDLIGDDAPALDLRIGVATGPVIVGTIGSERARDFTVIGDTVNAGARLEAACKMYGVRILVDEATADAVRDEIALREIDTLHLAGKSVPMRVFQLLDPLDWIGPERKALSERYAEGLDAYRAGEWAEARRHFDRCLQVTPDDGPATRMLARIETLEADPPAGWQGIWTQKK